MSSWTASDWAGVYGAFLASVLGVAQWIQWHRSQNLLLLVNTTIHEFGRTYAKTSDIEIAITNRSSLDIYVHACWAGYSARNWKSPWRREVIEAFGPSAIDENGIITDRDAGYFDLPPGKCVNIHVARKRFQDLSEPTWKFGFCIRKCVAVNHSATAQPVFILDI